MMRSSSSLITMAAISFTSLDSMEPALQICRIFLQLRTTSAYVCSCTVVILEPTMCSKSKSNSKEIHFIYKFCWIMLQENLEYQQLCMAAILYRALILKSAERKDYGTYVMRKTILSFADFHREVNRYSISFFCLMQWFRGAELC